MPRSPYRNRLLAAVPLSDLAFLEQYLERVTLSLDQSVVEPFTPITHVYFVESGLLSVMAGSAPTARIEIGMIGPEGLAGTSVAFGASETPFRTIVRQPCVALRATRERFLEACHTAPGLHRLILRYAEGFGIQTAETSRAGACVNLETRLARWLLMAHDRIEGDVLTFTHDQVAQMLSTRRPGITDALHVLEGERLIRSKRAHILIRDRAGLKARTKGTYGVAEAALNRLIGSAGARLETDRNASRVRSPRSISPAVRRA